jgi:nucleoside-diphosphate-sugar epimerase
MTTVAITGSSGFIGRNLVSRLADSCRVLTMDKAGSPMFLQDLTQTVWPRATADVLVHLASLSNVYCEPGKEKELIEHNMELAKRALYWCEEKGVSLMIHASSSAVYGDRNSPPYSETDQCYPKGAYGESKLLCEEWLTNMAAKRGVKVLSFRFFNAIGNYQKKTMLPWLLLEAERLGTVLPIFGECWRSWTAVEDVCAVIHEAIMHPTSFPEGHTIVNLGLDNPISQMELIALFRSRRAQVMELKTKMEAHRPFDMKVTKPDNRLFNQLFAHRLSFEALQSAVDDVIRYHNYETRDL